MIVDERMVTFIHSLETENSEILETIEKEATKKANEVMTHVYHKLFNI